MAYFDLSRPYIKMCISQTGMNGFVPAAQVWSMLNSKRKMFFIKPHMVAGGREQLMITHTIGHALAKNSRNASMVGANHCQSGSNILVYDIHEYGSKFKFVDPSVSPGSVSNSETPHRKNGSKSASASAGGGGGRKAVVTKKQK